MALGRNEKLNVASIGCGGMGNSNLYGFLRKRDTHVLAVCDVDSARRVSTRQAVEEYYASGSRAGTYAGCCF